tara:strand:+ start:164 stop:301 length:138 start_codon:yes stop_codon:yes gene_type:complete
MTVTIQIEIDADEICETYDEAVKEAVYQYLMELIDDDSLDFTIET